MVISKSQLSTFPCYLVRQGGDSPATAGVEMVSENDLPPGEVLVHVAYSSLNYKDAMACQGHPGIVRSFPHVPGIDCAGTVVESAAGECQPGDEVLVTGYELGSGRWGGFARYVRVPAEWVVRLPEGLSAREAMVYGTAGFTAAQCVTAIVERGIRPEDGPVVVTGATGGVGALSVAILAKLGYAVAAVTGKAARHDWLRDLGATRILERDEIVDASDRPLLAARWAAAVDTVGGRPLETILRATRYRGCVAACGLVAGPELALSVYPFILRGVTLAGIDSAKCPRPQRLEMWRRLAGEWRVANLGRLAEEVSLDELGERVSEMLAGRHAGRTLVVPRSDVAEGE